jgi:hypothetical protein
LIWGVFHYGFSEGDVDKGMAYSDKALELHGAEARQMQASLSGFPATDPPEATFQYKALNDVGLAVFGKGELLERKGDLEGAEAAYTMVVQEFGYAQVQDLGEWDESGVTVPRDANGFFKLAEAAEQKLTALQSRDR